MKSGTNSVTVTKDGKRQEVGIATFPIYESFQEVLDDLGEEKALELINAQVRTNEMNRVRSMNRPGAPTKTALKNKALASITAEEWAEIAGDASKIDALIESKVKAMQAELQAAESSSEEPSQE